MKIQPVGFQFEKYLQHELQRARQLRHGKTTRRVEQYCLRVVRVKFLNDQLEDTIILCCYHCYRDNILLFRNYRFEVAHCHVHTVQLKGCVLCKRYITRNTWCDTTRPDDKFGRALLATLNDRKLISTANQDFSEIWSDNNEAYPTLF